MIKLIFAFVKRELHLFKSTKTSMLTQLTIPLLACFLYLIGVDKYINLPFNRDYFGFVLPGLIFLAFLSPSLKLGKLMLERHNDLIKLLKVSPANKYSLVLGLILGEITFVFVTSLFLWAVLFIYIGTIPVINLLIAMLYLIFFSIGFLSFALCISYFFKKAYYFVLFFSYFSLINIFLSGAFFPISNLPGFIKYFALINPSSYVMDAVRFLLTGAHELNLFAGLIWVFCFSIISFLLAVKLFDRPKLYC